MTVVSFLKEAGTKGYLTLGILRDGEKRILTVSEEAFADAGSPLRGEELDEETFRFLSEEGERYAVVLRALRILSYADNSERSLTDKLRRAGFSADAAQNAAEEMVRLGYLNEERQLERLIAAEANGKLSGPRRVCAALAAKGYPAAKIRAVLRRLTDSGEIDFSENFSRLLQKEHAETEEDIRKIRFRHGY